MTSKHGLGDLKSRQRIELSNLVDARILAVAIYEEAKGAFWQIIAMITLRASNLKTM